MLTFSWVNSCRIIDKPVTPPSNILLGSINPLNETTTHKTPIHMYRKDVNGKISFQTILFLSVMHDFASGFKFIYFKMAVFIKESIKVDAFLSQNTTFNVVVIF